MQDLLAAIDGAAADELESVLKDGLAAATEVKDRDAFVAIRAAEREILEGVSLADAVAQRFPSRIKRLLDNPSAWR